MRLAAIALALLSAPALGQGYVPRPSGLVAPVCAGEEGPRYVDAQAGADSPACGSTSEPCATIAHAWREGGTVCLSGVAREQAIDPGAGGIEAIQRVPPTGSQVRAWEYPAAPARLVGWDRDGDGVYPPVDADDAAVLDGAGLGRAFVLSRSHVEIAHLEIRDYGLGANGDSGVWKWTGSGDVTHHWYHDLRITGINQGPGGGSGTSLANLFSNTVRLAWIAWENIELLDIDDWGWRGSGGLDADEGPFRLQGLTYRMRGCNYSECGDAATLTFWKTWAHLSQVEILDNVLDGNTSAWEPKPSGGPHGTLFVALTPCSQGFVIRNNLLRNIKVGLMLQPGFGNIGCVRPISGVLYEGNVSENSHPWGMGSAAILHVADRVSDPRATVQGIEIRGNIVREIDGGNHDRAIGSYHEAAGSPGSIMVEANVVSGTKTCVVNDAAGVGTWSVVGNHCAVRNRTLVLSPMPVSWTSIGNTYAGNLGTATEGWLDVSAPVPEEPSPSDPPEDPTNPPPSLPAELELRIRLVCTPQGDVLVCSLSATEAG